MRAPEDLTDRQIDEFIVRHRLPPDFRGTIDRCYRKLAAWIVANLPVGATRVLGISGAQGTGKSTLADFLRLALEHGGSRRVANLSLDDFYLTRAERQALAARVHPLFATRGVPGTHDLRMLADCLGRARSLQPGEVLALPRFDKALDDRADPGTWPVVTGPIDLILLEGWCLGCRPQPASSLVRPVNDLEALQDPSGAWRAWVNERLAREYATLFASLDALVVLQAPGWDAVLRWRLQQEEELVRRAGHDAPGVMDAGQLTAFMHHFERLTRAMLRELPDLADVVLELDAGHRCIRGSP